jgi:hypothetical protein
MSSTINLLSPPWLAIRAQLRGILETRAEDIRNILGAQQRSLGAQQHIPGA